MGVVLTAIAEKLGCLGLPEQPRQITFDEIFAVVCEANGVSEALRKAAKKMTISGDNRYTDIKKILEQEPQ